MSIKEVKSLKAIADDLFKKRDFVVAIEQYERILELLDRNDPLYARIYARISYQLILSTYRNNEVAKSEQYVDLMFELDLDPEMQLLAYIERYHCSTYSGNTERAYESIKCGLEIALKYFPNNKLKVSEVLRFIGNISFFRKGPFLDEGYAYCLEALDLWLEIDQPDQDEVFEITSVYRVLMQGAILLGNHEEIEKFYKLGIEYGNKIIRKQDVSIAIHRNYVAGYFKYNSISKSRKIIEKAIIEGKKLFGNSWEGTTHNINFLEILAELEVATGDYYEGLYYAQLGLELGLKTNFFDRNRAHKQLSKIYQVLGNEELALEHALKDYELTSNNTPGSIDLAISCNDLGLLHLKNNPDLSQSYFLKSKEILENRGLTQGLNFDYAAIWQGLLSICKIQEVPFYMDKILKFCQFHKKRSALIAPLYFCLAKKLASINDVNAIAYFKISLSQLLPYEFDLVNSSNLEKDLIDYKLGWECISGLAQLYLKQYQKNVSNKTVLMLAEAYFNLSFKLLNLTRNNFKSDSSKIVMGEMLDENIVAAIETTKLIGSTDKNNKIFELIENGKAGVLHSNLTEGKAKELLENTPYYERERLLKEEITVLGNQWENENSKDQSKDLEKITSQFISKREAYQNLIQEIEQEFPTYNEIKYQSLIVDLNAIQQSLNKGQKILNYFMQDQILIAFVIDKEETHFVEIELPVDFEIQIDGYVKAINRVNEEQVDRLGLQLYQLLISPVGDLLFDVFGDGTIQPLIIIPHSYLAKIPFESLLKSPVKEGSNKQYLLNYFDVSYHYSCSLWYLQKNKKKPKISQLEFMGMAPVYADETEEVSDFNELLFSEEEVHEIASLYEQKGKPKKVFVNQKASKKVFLKESPHSKILHLAAHFYQDALPQLSGLVFAQDEILYIQEAFNLKLNAELVVLSACESAIGKLYKNEGMMAINRGLLYSGARNILSTLFKVNDSITSKLMKEFYVNYLNGQNTSKALANAKRTILKESRFIPTKYWSAFILMGE